MTDADGIPLAGDDSEYDDVDPDTAFQIGLLSELSAIRQSLQHIEATLADEPVSGEEPASDRVMYECRSCGRVIEGVPAAFDHATTEHGAPADSDAWQTMMTEQGESDDTR